MLKGFRKFVPAMALAGALLAAALPAGSARAQTVPFSSGFQVQNLASSGATLSMAFYNEDGTAPAATIPASIAANGQVTYATLPSGVAAGFKGSAVISSDQRIAAIVNLVSPNNANITLGSSYVGVTGGSNRVSLPLLFKDYFGYNSFFSVQNVGQAATTVTVTYAGGGVAANTTDTVTIQPGASHRFDQAASTKLPADFNGSAIVTSSGSNIAAVVTQYGRGQSLTYNGFATGSKAPIFPLINTNNFGYRTGISLQNAGTTATNVTVTYTASAGGASCTETQSIPGNGGTAFFALYAFGGQKPANVTITENCPDSGAFVGSARVTTNSANADLVGIVNQTNDGELKGGSYSSFDAATATNRVVYPLIQDRFFGYNTGFSMINVGTVATTITCTYSGTNITQTSPSLAPGAGWTVQQTNLIQDRYNGSGTCTASGATARIVGVANQLQARNIVNGVESTKVDRLFVYEGTNTSN